MPEYRKETTGAASLAIWRIEEDEEGLKQYIGGDSFPVLQQFNNAKRRLEWLAARCCLKMLGISDPIVYAPNRRPFLSNGRMHISISHSYPLVTVIASSDFFVGIDIESLNRDYARIADKYLTFGEKGWVHFDNAKQMSLIWSAKEALYKLPGMEGLNSFVDMTTLPITEVRDRGVLQMRVRLGGLVQLFNLEYTFLDDYTITWVSCNPQLMEWGKRINQREQDEKQ